MDFKIFKVNGRQILAYRNINDDCMATIHLMTWQAGSDQDCYHEEVTTFMSNEAAKRFIVDLSELAIKEFVDRFVE